MDTLHSVITRTVAVASVEFALLPSPARASCDDGANRGPAYLSLPFENLCGESKGRKEATKGRPIGLALWSARSKEGAGGDASTGSHQTHVRMPTMCAPNVLPAAAVPLCPLQQRRCYIVNVELEHLRPDWAIRPLKCLRIRPWILISLKFSFSQPNTSISVP